MSLTLATFLATDADNSRDDAHVRHPGFSKHLSAKEQSLVYWQNVVVSCATARRCLPDVTLQVYTNDPTDIEYAGISLTRLLDHLKVERIPLSFSHFKPPQAKFTAYRNTIYRLEVIRALAMHGESGSPTILLDNDCLWTRPLPDLAERVPQIGLWLSSPYGTRPPYLRHPHHLSRADLGDIYKQLDAAYSEPYPHHYGGEFIGARPMVWQALADAVEDAWQQIVVQNPDGLPPLANGTGFFDGDEIFLNYIFNSHRFAITLAGDVMRRILTLEGVNNQCPKDELLALWHLPSEKQRGIRLLFDEVLRPTSLFWQTDLSSFQTYLGAYVGIPKRIHDLQYSPTERVERYARHLARWLRRWNLERKLAV